MKLPHEQFTCYFLNENATFKIEGGGTDKKTTTKVADSNTSVEYLLGVVLARVVSW